MKGQILLDALNRVLLFLCYLLALQMLCLFLKIFCHILLKENFLERELMKDIKLLITAIAECFYIHIPNSKEK